MQLELLVKDPVIRGGLALFPVFSTSPSGGPYLTGADADVANALEIGEQDDGPIVPELLVKNVAPLPVLLVEGETLVGAWQNRTLNVSVLVGAGTKIAIPVSCVEAGRWGGATSMGRSGRHAPSDLRRLKTESVNESRRLGRPARSDQGAVWDRVRDYGDAFAAALPTEALDDVYALATPELDAMLVDLDPAPGQRGVVVAVGGVVRGIDCFDKESTLAAYWQGLVAGYALDALQAPEGAPTVEAADSFIARVLAADGATSPAVGLGRDHVITGDGVTGHALEWDGAIVHLAAFATTGTGRPPRIRTIDRHHWFE